MKQLLILWLAVGSFIVGCDKKDDFTEPELPAPILENLELGLADAGIGVIAEDFHFEADVVAAERLDVVTVDIVQKSGTTYSKPWSHQIVWDQYKGLKNTNIHKHFKIPDDAAEGKYDLIVTITDENGAKLEIKRDFEIFSRSTLPNRPTITGIYAHRNWKKLYDSHVDSLFAENTRFVKGDSLQVQVNVSFVKGDGQLYILLINKQSGHQPQTISEIDFDKAIVYDVFAHKGEQVAYDFSNSIFDFETFTVVRDIVDLPIGAALDNNTPKPLPITGDKAWKSGEYDVVILYHNETINKTLRKTIPISVQM